MKMARVLIIATLLLISAPFCYAQIELLEPSPEVGDYYFENSLRYKAPEGWIFIDERADRISFYPKETEEIVSGKIQLNKVVITIFKPSESRIHLRSIAAGYRKGMEDIGYKIMEEKFTRINRMNAYDVIIDEKRGYVEIFSMRPITRIVFLQKGRKETSILYRCYNKGLYNKYLEEFEESLNSIKF